MTKYEVSVSGHAECSTQDGHAVNAAFSFTATIEADDDQEAESEAQDLASSLIRQLDITSCNANAYETECDD